MKKLVLIIVLFMTLLNGAEEIRKKPFEELIIGYNHGFIKAMQKGKFEHLQEYLTQEIYYKTLIWIDSYHSNNLFMDSIFLNVKFEELKMEQYSASLVSNEEWKYRYIDITKNLVVVPPKKVFYKMKYFFILLENGTWKINHIKILSEKEEEIKDK